MLEPRIQRAPLHPPMRALVVEDRTDVARTLALVLRQLGTTVEVAYHAQEALEKGAVMRPDVIFLGIGLPDGSGYDVCKEMRRSAWAANSFIVAVTGHNDVTDVIRSANTGFDRHVAKPMDMGTLKEILHTVKVRLH